MSTVLPMVLAAGGLVSAYGQLAQGRAQASAANRSVDLALATAAADADAQRRRGRLATGAAAAQYGASGLSFVGTPTDMLAQSAMFAELDAQNILYRGDVEAYGFRQQAAQARTTSRINAASTILQTGAGVYSSMGMFGGAENMGQMKTGNVPVPGRKPI